MNTWLFKTLQPFGASARAVVSVLVLTCPVVSRAATATVQGLTCAEMEEFLRLGKIGEKKNISHGVTLPSRATLEYQGMVHDAAIQTVEISKSYYQTNSGSEINFRDSWKYNVAGYELAKILELNMVPPYVERSIGGQPASFSWWIDNAMMELDRRHHKRAVPDIEAWNRQMYAVRVWHELIYDTDPNLTNLLITKDWQLWIIDFTRAFRLHKQLRDSRNLVQCDRKLLAKLRILDRDMLREKLSRWLTNPEIDGLVARAGIIVRFFDKEAAMDGESAVFYDFPRSQQACGVGL